MKEKIFSHLISFKVLVLLIIVVSILIVLIAKPMGTLEIEGMPVVSEMDAAYADLKEIANEMAANKTTDYLLSEKLLSYEIIINDNNYRQVTLNGAHNTFLTFVLLDNYELQLESDSIEYQKLIVSLSQIFIFVAIIMFYIAVVALPMIAVAYIGKVIYVKKKQKKSNV